MKCHQFRLIYLKIFYPHCHIINRWLSDGNSVKIISEAKKKKLLLLARKNKCFNSETIYTSQLL